MLVERIVFAGGGAGGCHVYITRQQNIFGSPYLLVCYSFQDIGRRTRQ